MKSLTLGFEADFQRLETKLSKESSVVLPSDAEYKEFTTRWSDFNAIKPGGVVNNGCEEDIWTTVSVLIGLHSH